LLAGDPIEAAPGVASLADLATTLGLDPQRTGYLAVAPGAGLVHALTESEGHLALRWVRLPEARALAFGAPPSNAVAVLTAPVRQSSQALRVAAHLIACCRQPGVLERARAAATREALVEILAAVEQQAGEASLPGPELVALLGSSATGLAELEAAPRQAACGPNRIEHVRHGSLALRLLEQFRSFFALLLWVASVLAFVARMPELGGAIVAVIVVNGVFSFFQEYRAERSVEALQELLPHEIAVLRDGPGDTPTRGGRRAR
jgi:hypothetical protein